MRKAERRGVLMARSGGMSGLGTRLERVLCARRMRS
jgi:hypothetical protein